MASRTRCPSCVVRYAPSALTTVGSVGRNACCVKGCHIGECVDPVFIIRSRCGAREKALAWKRSRKCGRKSRRRQRIQARKAAEDRYPARLAQGALVVRMRISNQGDANHGDRALSQGLE